MTMTPEQRDEDCARRACIEHGYRAGSIAMDVSVTSARLSRELAESVKADAPPAATHNEGGATDEEIADEVSKRIAEMKTRVFPVQIAALTLRLRREGWTPTPPVDPDVLAVRALCLDEFPEAPFSWELGEGDTDFRFKLQINAYRAGRESERAKS